MSKTRIPNEVKRLIWFNAHGRCEFSGCNKRLDLHGVTLEKCDFSNYAHIIGDSEKGPRGGKDSKKLAKDPRNLILLCPECHRLIDHEGVEKYTTEVLRAMKREHEERIDRVTGIQPEKKSLVVSYTPKIGEDTVFVSKEEMYSTIFPDRYPMTPEPVEIQINNTVMRDDDPEYWAAEVLQIERMCEKEVFRALRGERKCHISLFAVGPQPLLVKLGSVLNDKYHIQVYQKHRTPETWRWLDEAVKNEIWLEEPAHKGNAPVLVVALCAKAIKERIANRFGNEASVWTISCDEPNPDMMKTRSQLDEFDCVARKAMDDIKTSSPSAKVLKIFLAAPASCSIELGRIRMAKADLKWELYDYRESQGIDIKTITIG